MILNEEDKRRLNDLFRCKYLMGDIITFTNASGIVKTALFLEKKGEILTIWCDGAVKYILLCDNVELLARAYYGEDYLEKIKEVKEIINKNPSNSIAKKLAYENIERVMRG